MTMTCRHPQRDEWSWTSPCLFCSQLVCGSCYGHHTMQQHPELSVAKRAACVVVLDPRGLVLSVSRKTDHAAVGLPGGKAEYGETFEACAIRELREETSVVATSLESIWTGIEDDSEYQVTTFLARSWTGTPVSREGSRVEFVTWDQLCTESPWNHYNRTVRAIVEKLDAPAV